MKKPDEELAEIGRVASFTARGIPCVTWNVADSCVQEGWRAAASAIAAAVREERADEVERLREALQACWNDFGYYGNGGVGDETVQMVKKALEGK